jgi:penicillin V acylase-like amidase (Ntn superfamily)
MTARFVATIGAAILAVLIATPAFTCTTLCLLEKGRALVAYNYDFYASEGLVLVNKRGTSKKSRVEHQGASWTAQHGSVTFNQFGRDNPNTGVNEKGLMVSLMWLDATRYPPADHRPAIGILEWIQYNLDNHASVAEVVANAEAVRPPSRGPAPIHYLFADASGDAAAIEFLDGKLVVHRGETLPVKALTNSTYADSLAAFEAARRAGEMPTSRSSLDRFVRGAMLASGDGDPIARGFAALAATAVPGRTRWSIVYDLGAGEVYFKTDTNATLRRFTLTSFDFSCRTPVKMLDVTATGSGDVATAFVDYTRAANRALLEASYAKTPFLRGRSDTQKAAAVSQPDATSSCVITD